MAGADVYVNENVASDKLGDASRQGGSRTITMVESEELIVSDGSVTPDIYRFFKGINPNLIPIDIKIYVDDAVVGATDMDVGLYKVGIGETEVDSDVFADGIDLSPAGGAIRGGGVIGHDEFIDGLVGVDIANLTKKLYEHGGHTVANYLGGYDLALTSNVSVTTGGTVTIIAQFIEG